jgi:hypothetical protein
MPAHVILHILFSNRLPLSFVITPKESKMSIAFKRKRAGAMRQPVEGEIRTVNANHYINNLFCYVVFSYTPKYTPKLTGCRIFHIHLKNPYPAAQWIDATAKVTPWPDFNPLHGAGAINPCASISQSGRLVQLNSPEFPLTTVGYHSKLGLS